MTVTEPEFDATERDGWAALAEYEDALCPQCGGLRIECEDPEGVWHPDIQACYRTAAQAMADRRWRRKHKDTKPDGDGWLPTDGALIYVSDQEPAIPLFAVSGKSDSSNQGAEAGNG